MVLHGATRIYDSLQGICHGVQPMPAAVTENQGRTCLAKKRPPKGSVAGVAGAGVAAGPTTKGR